MIQARYTEVLYNLLNNARTKQLIDQAMSEYRGLRLQVLWQISLVACRWRQD